MMSRSAFLLAVALASVAAPAGAQQKPPQHPVPGGPVGATQPDLIVDSIVLSLNKAPGPCYQYHVARFDVSVTIRNVGLGPAAMKTGSKWAPWVTISTLDGTGKSYMTAGVHAAATKIPPNGTHKLTTIVAAPVAVPLNKASSTVTIAATVNPAKLITTESNYGDNTKQISQTFPGEL
ncbi:MAG: hypothetical protein ACM3N5_07205, partial [Candidatus Eiseniibacteriota bacterium]